MWTQIRPLLYTVCLYAKIGLKSLQVYSADDKQATFSDAVFLGALRVKIYEPAHNKTYSKTCETSKDSDQPVHPPSMARVLVRPSLDSPEAVEGACSQRRLIRLSGLSWCCSVYRFFPADDPHDIPSLIFSES